MLCCQPKPPPISCLWACDRSHVTPARPLPATLPPTQLHPAATCLPSAHQRDVKVELGLLHQRHLHRPHHRHAAQQRAQREAQPPPQPGVLHAHLHRWGNRPGACWCCGIAQRVVKGGGEGRLPIPGPAADPPRAPRR
jgi:hypothetical protein